MKSNIGLIEVQKRLLFDPKIVLFHPHFNLSLNVKFASFQEICYPERRVGFVYQFFPKWGFLFPLCEAMGDGENVEYRGHEVYAPRERSLTLKRVFHSKHVHRVAKSAIIHPPRPVKSPKKG